MKTEPGAAPLHPGAARDPDRLWIRDVGSDSDVSVATEDSSASEPVAKRQKQENQERNSRKKRATTLSSVKKQKGLYDTIQAKSWEDHVEQAVRLDQKLLPEESDLPGDMGSALDFLAKEPDFGRDRREQKHEFWKGRVEKTTATTEAMVDKSHPAFEIAKRQNPAVLQEIFDHLNVGGRGFVKRMAVGHPLVGIFDEPGVYKRKKFKARICSKQELLAQQNLLIEHIQKTSAKETEENLDLIWESVMEEAELGFLSGPYEADDPELPDSFLPMRRFIVEQTNKKRPCDNAKKSGVNRLVETRTPIALHTIDDAILAAKGLKKRLRELGRDDEIALAKFDHKVAYKHILIKKRHRRFCVIVALDPTTMKLYFFVANVLTFGPAAGVINYNMLSRVVMLVARRELGLPLTGFFDDFITPVPKSEAKRISEDFIRFFRDVLGQDFRMEKCEWGVDLKYLGLFLNVSFIDYILVSLGQERTQKLLKQIEEILRQMRLSPEEAAELAGRLQFAQAAFFGKVGRAYLHPMYRRIYNRQPSIKLNNRLKKALEWWKRVLKNTEFQRKIPLKELRPVIVYTDAIVGHLGANLIDPENSIKEEISLPVSQADLDLCEKIAEEDVKKETEQIQLHETLAVDKAMDKWADRLKGRFVIWFVDNESLQGAWVKGHSSSNLYTGLIESLWEKTAKLSMNLWIERVCSKDNPADIPSRGGHCPGFRRIEY